MKKFTKVFALIMSVIMIACAFAACTGNGTGDESQASGAVASGEVKKVGIIQYAPHASLDNCYKGLIQGLEEAGYQDGEKIKIDFQNANGEDQMATQIANNMAAQKYDLIIGIATPAATAAYSAARSANIPTVFCAVSDPVAAKLVESLDKPGNNTTGTSDLLNLEAQMKMIRALQPDAKKIGVLYTTSEANSVSHLKQFKELAPKYGFEIVDMGVQSAADIPQAAATLAAKVDCINNFTDNNVVNNLGVVLAKANEAGIPVYGSEIEQVEKGCLASESLDYVALGKETGKLAGQVLDGADAGSIPVSRVKDSAPVYNSEVLAKCKLSLPEAYKDAQKVTTAS